MPVGEVVCPRDHQQAGAVARLGRAVGDQVAREIEIEIAELHRRHYRANAEPLSDASYGPGRGSCYALPQRHRTVEALMSGKLTRRAFGKAAAATALAASVPQGSLRAADHQNTLRFIAQSDLRVLDPVWTTAYITRNHAYCVFDNLLAIDAEFAPHPQMVGDYNISPDKLTYQFKLRDGLGFHDGSPV